MLEIRTLEIHIHNIEISLNNGNTYTSLAISLNKLRNTCVIWIHFHKSSHKWRCTCSTSLNQLFMMYPEPTCTSDNGSPK